MTKTSERRPGSRGPLPTGIGTPVVARLQPDLLSPLDAWIDTLDPKPSRPEAVRMILKDWLTGMGYLRHREDPEGAN